MLSVRTCEFGLTNLGPSISLGLHEATTLSHLDFDLIFRVAGSKLRMYGLGVGPRVIRFGFLNLDFGILVAHLKVGP